MWFERAKAYAAVIPALQDDTPAHSRRKTADDKKTAGLSNSEKLNYSDAVCNKGLKTCSSFFWLTRPK